MAGQQTWTRRDVLKTSAATAGALTLAGPASRVALGQGAGGLRLGLIGCSDLGVAMAGVCLAGVPGSKVVAVSDPLADRVGVAGGTFGLNADQCFAGLDGYGNLLAVDAVDAVLIADVPVFRPVQFAAAVEQGKHAVVVAPAAICPTGIKMVQAAAEKAAEKQLTVIAGLAKRRDAATVETMKRIQDGAIGEIVSAQSYTDRVAPPVAPVPRTPGLSDVEWQLRNAYYFRWTSGDWICHDLVHQFDVINWAFGNPPYLVHAVGGRQAEYGPEYGNIYDHFGIEFEYPESILTLHHCRQIVDTDTRNEERVVGSKGASNCAGVITGENAWTYAGPKGDAITQTFVDLAASIAGAKGVNEGRILADSALTVVMARESAYSWKRFKRSWFLSRCGLSLLPPGDLRLSDGKPVAPVAVPGQYQLAGMPRR